MKDEKELNKLYDEVGLFENLNWRQLIIISLWERFHKEKFNCFITLLDAGYAVRSAYKKSQTLTK